MDEDKIFNALEIRDIANHDSDESSSGEFLAKTIFIQNTLDQQVTFKLQGARDSIWLNIGSSFNVAATTNTYQTVSDYFPKYRLKAICSVVPASGTLDVWIIKAGG